MNIHPIIQSFPLSHSFPFEMKYFALWRFYDCLTTSESFEHLTKLRELLESEVIQFEGPFLNNSTDFVPISPDERKVQQCIQQVRQRHLFPILLMKTNLQDSVLDKVVFERKDQVNCRKILTQTEYDRLIFLYKIEKNSKLIKEFWTEQEALKGVVFIN